MEVIHKKWAEPSGVAVKDWLPSQRFEAQKVFAGAVPIGSATEPTAPGDLMFDEMREAVIKFGDLLFSPADRFCGDIKPMLHPLATSIKVVESSVKEPAIAQMTGPSKWSVIACSTGGLGSFVGFRLAANRDDVIAAIGWVAAIGAVTRIAEGETGDCRGDIESSNSLIVKTIA